MFIIKKINEFLNNNNMYKIVIYSLLGISFMSFILSLFGIVSFKLLDLASSFFIFITTSVGFNYILSKIFKSPINNESAIITGLILFLIIPPTISFEGIITIVLASTISIGAKFFISYKYRSIFNPAAVGVFLLSLTSFGFATWWVSSKALLIPVLIFGLLVVYKIRRFSLFISFIIASILSIIINSSSISSTNFIPFIFSIFTSWPIIFFGAFMLIEPLTTPPTKKLQIIYGSLIGLILGSNFHIAGIYMSPELALIIGNLFSFYVSLRSKLKLKLISKNKLSSNVYEFVFENLIKNKFKSGQYLEWIVDHEKNDSKGKRRFFTISSSPSEDTISFATKFFDKSSSFKNALMNLNNGDFVFASQLSGDFILPENKNKKLVFIAGGIGITPFISMIKHLSISNDSRDVILIYSNSNIDDIPYREFLDNLEKENKLKVIYINGRIDKEFINKNITNYHDRAFYLSGPSSMVSGCKKSLKEFGIKNIKTDYFPGF